MVGSKTERLHRPWIRSCAAAGESSSGDSSACSTSSVTSVEQLDDDRGDVSQEPSGWTDDRHSSYLSSMEEMFVRNLYDREYCAADICGQVAPRDCVESKPSCSFFEMLRTGDWHPLPSERLHSWELPQPSAFVSPRTRAECSSSSTTSTDEQVVCRTSIASELEQEQVLWVPDLETTESRFSDTGGSKARRVNSSGSKRALKRHKAHSGTSRSEAKNPRSQTKECSRLDQVVPLGLDDLTRESDSSTKAIPGTVVRMRR